MQDREVRLNVADVVVSLAIGEGVGIAGHVDSFLVDGPAEATVHVQVTSENRNVKGLRPLSVGEHLGWNAFGTADGKSILVRRLGGDVTVCFAAEPVCDTVDVLLGAPRADNPLCSGGEWARRELLLVEVLPLPVVVLLAGRQGLFLHSCAVALEDKGILFSGVSGSGKSTMAELWRQWGPSTSSVVDDEHILVRQGVESAVLYGAPWSRGAREARFSRTPLKAVFFLVHGKQNQCARLASGEALAELLSQVFLPLWSREQLELTMQTCSDLLGKVDCYRLQFVPDRRVIAFVQDVLGDFL
jgi:hypothetical protein